MDNVVTVSNNELPQLRKMVLENTRRIINNEQMIDEIRKKVTDEEQKLRERDEFWENAARAHELARQEHDRDMHELRQMFKESDKRMEESKKEFDRRMAEFDRGLAESRKEFDRRMVEFDRGLAESRKEFDRQMAESREKFDKSREEFDRRLAESREKFDKSREEFDRRLAESREEFNRGLAESKEDFDRRMAEFDRGLAETQKLVKETTEQVKETSKEVKLLSRQFNGETGHIVEGLVSSSAEKLFLKFGLDLHNSGKNLRRHLKSEKLKMEVDVLLSNDKVAVPIEVKTKFTEENLNWFLHQMEMFRKLFPEHADKEVIAAIAAIDYDMGVDTLAHEAGLLVIRVNSDDIFTLDPFDVEKLKRF